MLEQGLLYGNSRFPLQGRHTHCLVECSPSHGISSPSSHWKPEPACKKTSSCIVPVSFLAHLLQAAAIQRDDRPQVVALRAHVQDAHRQARAGPRRQRPARLHPEICNAVLRGCCLIMGTALIHLTAKICANVLGEPPAPGFGIFHGAFKLSPYCSGCAMPSKKDCGCIAHADFMGTQPGRAPHACSDEAGRSAPQRDIQCDALHA